MLKRYCWDPKDGDLVLIHVAVKKLVVGYLVSDSVLDSQNFWKFSHCWIYHIVSPLRVRTWFGKRITLKK